MGSLGRLPLGGSPQRRGVVLGLAPRSGCLRQCFLAMYLFANCYAKRVGMGVSGNNGPVMAQARGTIRQAFSVVQSTCCFYSCEKYLGSPVRGDINVGQGEERVPDPRSHCLGNREAQCQACLCLLDLGTPQVLHCAGYRVMLCHWGLGLGGQGCYEGIWPDWGLEEGKGRAKPLLRLYGLGLVLGPALLPPVPGVFLLGPYHPWGPHVHLL